MSGPQMHPCPGGCGRRQVRAWPCRTCLQRLPEPIQQRLRFIGDGVDSSTALYQETFAAAAAWFRTNPGVRVIVDAADEKRILTHYAAGTEISGIASICGLHRDAVLDVVNRRAGFSRDKARELVNPASYRRRPTTAKRHREEPLPPVVDEPASVEPPVCLEAADPEPADPDPAPLPAEPAPVSTGDAPEVTGDVDEHLVDVEPEPEPASPPALTPTVSPLLAYDAWLCLQCGSRWSESQRCCRRSTIPVTVTVTRRAA